MADRQDLLLLRMAEDLRQRVLEPVALIGEPTLPSGNDPDPFSDL
jgi:hypothetical protein